MGKTNWRTIVLVALGAFFPDPTDFWNGTITGRITGAIAEPIFNSIAFSVVPTFQCIDEKTGSVTGYSPFDAATGQLRCEEVG